MLYAQLILQTHEIHSEHNTSEIYSMFVDLHHRGKGVGTSLLAAVEQHCCLRNSTTLILYTGHSAPAVDFYLKNGFTIVGIRDPHFATKGFDLTMAKELKTEQYAKPNGSHRAATRESRMISTGSRRRLANRSALKH